ncbi:uncharacterized protein LOC125230736 [Leguminivora glycinivorella]|uniref:uncharacterized protein LOC125230736 n=1 Tax=Leguminivora glycinivorella TaxID=1035111 RepID=UPI002010512B|nr:uncharacterized protein LOC125230736 [Leguminivora glycinivorella]
MITRFKKYLRYNYDRNVVEVFKPLYMLLSVTGLFPYAVEFPRGRRDTTITRKSLIKVYNQLIFSTVPDAIPSLVVAFYSAMVLLVVCLLKNIEEHCQMIVSTDRVRTAFATNSSESIDRRVTCGGLGKDWVRVDNLEQVYVKVLEIKQDINNAFQAPISLIIIQCFHGLLSESHALYSRLVVDMSFDAHLLVEQTFLATKIGQALHNIPTANQNNRLLMEIQHFATLMSFRKPVVTVYDYFSLDATLLFSKVASAAMYLVILVQFDKPE